MIKIEVLMDFLHGGVQYYKGEQCFVTEEDAKWCCGAGWARDMAGDIPTGKPNTGDTQLAVDNVTLTSTGKVK